MVREGVPEEELEPHTGVFRTDPLVAPAPATSIGTLAAGISPGVLRTAVLIPALIIGTTGGMISFAGVILDRHPEALLGNRIKIAGCVILILIGVKIRSEHLLF
jgi:putative Mn2+ efflux pump MntP